MSAEELEYELEGKGRTTRTQVKRVGNLVTVETYGQRSGDAPLHAIAVPADTWQDLMRQHAKWYKRTHKRVRCTKCNKRFTFPYHKRCPKCHTIYSPPNSAS